MGFPELLLVLCVVALLIWLALIIGFRRSSKKAQMRRFEEMARLAERLGWGFEAIDTLDANSPYSGFAIFSQGGDCTPYNTIIGSIHTDRGQVPVRMGDFRYELASPADDRKHNTYRFSYFLMSVPYKGIAELSIQRETVLDRIAEAMGAADINFESEQFSRAFAVKCNEKKFAYEICHPKMMEFLLATRPPGVFIHSQFCCVSAGVGEWDEDIFLGLLKWAAKFDALWPAYTTNDA
jgi:hypothetical protein